MQQDKLLILGAGPWQGWLIKTARNMGIKTVVVDGNPRAKWHHLADEFYPVDLKNREEILSLAREKHVGGVLTSSSDVSLPAFKYILSEQKLTGISDFAIENTSNKYKMHGIFDRHSIPSSKYFLLDSCSRAGEAIKSVGGFPVVFKPLDNAGGRGVIVVSEDRQIKESYAYTRLFSKTDLILVEEFIGGDGAGAEIFALDGDIHLCFLMDDHYIPNYISPIGHILPSRVSGDVQNVIANYIFKLCDIFKLHGGNFNIDMKLTDEGPFFIEINPRMGGSNISELVYYSTGVNLAEYAVQYAMGMNMAGKPPGAEYNPSISALLRKEGDGQGSESLYSGGQRKIRFKGIRACS
jgi:biotin carboxylase